MSSRHLSFKLGKISREYPIWPKPEITIEIQQLYMRGKRKNSRITSEKAYDILNKTVIQYDWEQQIILSVPG